MSVVDYLLPVVSTLFKLSVYIYLRVVCSLWLRRARFCTNAPILKIPSSLGKLVIPSLFTIYTSLFVFGPKQLSHGASKRRPRSTGNVRTREYVLSHCLSKLIGAFRHCPPRYKLSSSASRLLRLAFVHRLLFSTQLCFFSPWISPHIHCVILPMMLHLSVLVQLITRVQNSSFVILSSVSTTRFLK